jgi:hypothetical protein
MSMEKKEADDEGKGAILKSIDKFGYYVINLDFNNIFTSYGKRSHTLG